MLQRSKEADKARNKDGKDIDYDGAAGPQDFDQFGDVVTHVEIWTIQEGKIETVRYEMPQ